MDIWCKTFVGTGIFFTNPRSVAGSAVFLKRGSFFEFMPLTGYKTTQSGSRPAHMALAAACVTFGALGFKSLLYRFVTCITQIISCTYDKPLKISLLGEMQGVLK
jgi:hypothetical protein